MSVQENKQRRTKQVKKTRTQNKTMSSIHVTSNESKTEMRYTTSVFYFHSSSAAPELTNMAKNTTNKDAKGSLL